MPLVRAYTVLQASRNCDDFLRPGEYALASPTNRPATWTNLVLAVYVGDNAGTLLIVQRAYSLADGTMKTRLFNGTSWGSWA